MVLLADNFGDHEYNFAFESKVVTNIILYTGCFILAPPKRFLLP